MQPLPHTDVLILIVLYTPKPHACDAKLVLGPCSDPYSRIAVVKLMVVFTLFGSGARISYQ